MSEPDFTERVDCKQLKLWLISICNQEPYEHKSVIVAKIKRLKQLKKTTQVEIDTNNSLNRSEADTVLTTILY